MNHIKNPSIYIGTKNPKTTHLKLKKILSFRNKNRATILVTLRKNTYSVFMYYV